jgi:hypothetical protein
MIGQILCRIAVMMMFGVCSRTPGRQPESDAITSFAVGATLPYR